MTPQARSRTPAGALFLIEHRDYTSSSDVLKAVRSFRVHGHRTMPHQPRLRCKKWLMSLTTQK